MIKVHQLLFIIFFGCISNLNGQNITKILTENQWSLYDNFAIIDFNTNGKAEIQYAYCTYCQGNKEILEWELSGKLLKLGNDSLVIKSASKNEIITNQFKQEFIFKNIDKLKESKLKKENVIEFLTSKNQITVVVKSPQLDNSNRKLVHFNKNGKMWLDQPQYRGQWALKSFFGDLFLIYIHRNTVNRDYPLLKIQSIKKGKLVGQPIPSIKLGKRFVLEFKHKD